MSVMFTKFADKPRPVLFDMTACNAAEVFLGYGLHKLLDEQSGPRGCMVVLWCGLNRKNSEITYSETMKLVDKAFKAKTLTMFELQKFVLRELKASGAISGYVAEEEEDEDSDELAGNSQSKDGENPLPV